MQIVWDLVLETIKSNYPELHPDALEMDFVASVRLFTHISACSLMSYAVGTK
jgi:hypothetical protein